jgi:hypothetical protein
MVFFIILVISFFNFVGSVKVDCGIKSDPSYRDFFQDLSYYFLPKEQICGFKVDESENSSEINFDFLVDNKTPFLTFVCTNNFNSDFAC